MGSTTQDLNGKDCGRSGTRRGLFGHQPHIKVGKYASDDHSSTVTEVESTAALFKSANVK